MRAALYWGANFFAPPSPHPHEDPLRSSAAVSRNPFLIFRKNVADYPDSWNVHDSPGEALAAVGETSDAIKHFEHARSMAPQQRHARIDGVLAQLRASN